MTLSILICSLHSRANMVRELMAHLSKQGCPEVEIITNTDGKKKTTGRKRNELVQRARGKYVVFIDDDDWVPEYYIAEMLRAAESDADCFAINGTMTTDGAHETRWRLSRTYENIDTVENGRPMLLRKTNHITGVKRCHAIRAPFPDKSNAEDKAYSLGLAQFLKTEFVIDKPMYLYRYASTNKQYT